MRACVPCTAPARWTSGLGRRGWTGSEGMPRRRWRREAEMRVFGWLGLVLALVIVVLIAKKHQSCSSRIRHVLEQLRARSLSVMAPAMIQAAPLFVPAATMPNAAQSSRSYFAAERGAGVSPVSLAA